MSLLARRSPYLLVLSRVSLRGFETLAERAAQLRAPVLHARVLGQLELGLLDNLGNPARALEIAPSFAPDALEFLGEIGVTYPNVFDATGAIRVALELTAYPTTYVFGADGALRARVDGGISEQRLAALIEDALS
mgnify:CR=1 FL=1